MTVFWMAFSLFGEGRGWGPSRLACQQVIFLIPVLLPGAGAFHLVLVCEVFPI